MKNLLQKIWLWIGLKFFFPTYGAWVNYANGRFDAQLDDIVDITFQSFSPTLDDWVQVTHNRFGPEINQFKGAAYDYRIKAEAGMADELGIGDAYRWGSETAKAEQEALNQARNGRKILPGGIMALGKSPQERRMEAMLERDDLIIGNMVKKAAKENGVEVVE